MSISKTGSAGAPAPELTPEEKANQIMACIYWDINCAAKFINLPQASQTEEDKTAIEIIRTNQQSFVDLVVYAYVKALESGPKFSKTVEDTGIFRFIRDHGWKIFSICSYSEAFQRACQDQKGIVAWWLVEKMIGENVRSIELFARCRSLDWSGPLLQHARWFPQLRRTLSPELGHLGEEHPHHTVMTLDQSLRRPRFSHQPQVHIKQHIYKADKDNNAPNPIMRKPEWGACSFCASTDICNCRVTPTSDDAVEIIEYPTKGLGIRALSNFRKGDWLGEFLGCVIPVEDVSETTIYDLEQGVWDKSFAGVSFKNAKAKGKKRLSTIGFIAPAHQGIGHAS
jgi:hypothetical protein